MDVLFESYAFSDLDQVFFSYPSVFRVVEQQVSKFSALLDEVYSSEAMNFVPEIMGAEQFAQHHSGIIEAQSLVEVTGQQESLSTILLFNHAYVLLVVSRPAKVVCGTAAMEDSWLPRCMSCRANS